MFRLTTLLRKRRNQVSKIKDFLFEELQITSHSKRHNAWHRNVRLKSNRTAPRNRAWLGGSWTDGQLPPRWVLVSRPDLRSHNQRSRKEKGRIVNPLIRLEKTTSVFVIVFVLAWLKLSPTA